MRLGQDSHLSADFSLLKCKQNDERSKTGIILLLVNKSTRLLQSGGVLQEAEHNTIQYHRALFSLHIYDITAVIGSEIRLFDDDCVCYREIKDKADTLKLQRDIDRLGNWARKWGMSFQPVKCNMMQLTRKHSNKNFLYLRGYSS